VIEKYPDQVKIVYKNFPVPSHSYAEIAARAALAAGKQGKFWEFHDLLFESYNSLNDEKVRQIAGQLKLNMPQFEADWKNVRIAAKVKSDMQEGKNAGVRGVPTVYVNGRQLRNRSLEGFSELIDKALKNSAAPAKKNG
jgi:protein-disulfide isomerase